MCVLTWSPGNLLKKGLIGRRSLICTWQLPACRRLPPAAIDGPWMVSTRTYLRRCNAMRAHNVARVPLLTGHAYIWLLEAKACPHHIHTGESCLEISLTMQASVLIEQNGCRLNGHYCLFVRKSSDGRVRQQMSMQNKLSRPAVSSSSRSMDTGSGLEMMDKWTQACQDRVVYLLYCSAQVQVYTARNVKTPCTYSLINRFDRCIFVSISAVLLCVAVKRSSPTRSAASDVGGVKMSRTSAARDGRTDVRASPGSFTSPFCPSFLVIVSCLAHFWTIAKFTRFCIHTTGSWFFSHSITFTGRSILVPTKVVLKLLLLVWCETSQLTGAACTCSLF